MVFGAREGFVEAPLTLSEPRASLRAAMMGWGLGLNPRRLSLILTSLHEHGLSPLHVGSVGGGDPSSSPAGFPQRQTRVPSS